MEMILSSLVLRFFCLVIGSCLLPRWISECSLVGVNASHLRTSARNNSHKKSIRQNIDSTLTVTATTSTLTERNLNTWLGDGAPGCHCLCDLAWEDEGDHGGVLMIAMNEEFKETYGDSPFCVSAKTSKEYYVSNVAFCTDSCQYQDLNDSETAEEKEEADEEEKGCHCPCNLPGAEGAGAGVSMYAITEEFKQKYGDEFFCVTPKDSVQYNVDENAFCEDFCLLDDKAEDATILDVAGKKGCHCSCDLGGPDGAGAGVSMFAMDETFKAKYGNEAFCVSKEDSEEYDDAVHAFCDDFCLFGGDDEDESGPDEESEVEEEERLDGTEEKDNNTGCRCPCDGVADGVRMFALDEAFKMKYGNEAFCITKDASAKYELAEVAFCDDICLVEEKKEEEELEEEKEEEEEEENSALESRPVERITSQPTAMPSLNPTTTSPTSSPTERATTTSPTSSPTERATTTSPTSSPTERATTTSPTALPQTSPLAAATVTLDASGKKGCQCACYLEEDPGVLMIAQDEAFKNKYGDEAFCVSPETSVKYELADVASCDDICLRDYTEEEKEEEESSTGCDCPCYLDGGDAGVLMVAKDEAFKSKYEEAAFCVGIESSAKYVLAEVAVCDICYHPPKAEPKVQAQEQVELTESESTLSEKEEDDKSASVEYSDAVLAYMGCKCPCDLPDSSGNGVLMYAMDDEFREKFGQESFCIGASKGVDYKVAEQAFCDDACLFDDESKEDGTEEADEDEGE